MLSKRCDRIKRLSHADNPCVAQGMPNLERRMPHPQARSAATLRKVVRTAEPLNEKPPEVKLAGFKINGIQAAQGRIAFHAPVKLFDKIEKWAIATHGAMYRTFFRHS
ncbi:MAG: hypothetical protein P4L33_05820 [Capsulimonadaceae bacterium]|nr:hypothetical protein [Capsulimonadaceae bacterium]